MDTTLDQATARLMAYRANFNQASKVKIKSAYLANNYNFIVIKRDIFVENNNKPRYDIPDLFSTIEDRADFKPNIFLSPQISKTQKIILDLHQKFPRVMANHVAISKKIREAMQLHEVDFQHGFVENKQLRWTPGQFEHPILFSLLVYENDRVDGMTLADLKRADPVLYSNFTAQCYYLGLRPRSIFELIDESARPNKALKALSSGLIDEDVVRCPKKSEIGISISEEEYRQQRCEYVNQLRRIKKAERRDPRGRLRNLQALNRN